MFKCLKELPAEIIYDEVEKQEKQFGMLFVYQPIHAGPDFPGLPLDVYAAGRENKVDLIAGVANDEGHIFQALLGR